MQPHFEKLDVPTKVNTHATAGHRNAPRFICMYTTVYNVYTTEPTTGTNGHRLRRLLLTFAYLCSTPLALRTISGDFFLFFGYILANRGGVAVVATVQYCRHMTMHLIGCRFLQILLHLTAPDWPISYPRTAQQPHVCCCVRTILQRPSPLFPPLAQMLRL